MYIKINNPASLELKIFVKIMSACSNDLGEKYIKMYSSCTI